MSQTLLYSESFDFKLFDKKPTSVICLLFVPRSGSTLLACLMQQTMALGFPLEYFDAVNLAILAQRLPGFSLSNPEPLMRVRTSPNGVFSFKLSNLLIGEYKDNLLNRLNAQHFLVMDRQDQEAQARSLAIAIQTKQWVQLERDKAVEIPQITDSSLLRAKLFLDNERNAIREFISQKRVSTLYISYEELISEPRLIIKQICNFLNIQSYQDVDISKVPVRKQS